ncbi:MAG: hypothetical protein OXE82_15325, partial [Rhodobacter sp.]|nr:hypothetical protein [Rhodobacter sp.]
DPAVIRKRLYFAMQDPAFPRVVHTILQPRTIPVAVGQIAPAGADFLSDAFRIAGTAALPWRSVTVRTVRNGW